MKILITGWYGTETIGDRAILASLLMLSCSITNKLEIIISSIYPFHTQRTIVEDSMLYSSICDIPEELINCIRIVDSRDVHEYSKAIKSCDLLIMGGGPFDDMASMHMVEYGFVFAKRKKKKTLVFGCGLNVLKKKEFILSTIRIMNSADAIILRDKKSIELLKQYGYSETNRIIQSIDPAVFIAAQYKSRTSISGNEYAVINLRDFPDIYLDNCSASSIDINKLAWQLVDNFLIQIKPLHSLGIGMNYFAVGGDDRIILNKCKSYIQSDLDVVNRTLNLKETMDYYMQSKYCLGMRFHAVVLQTILNGNNYILNYTSTKNGKIPGFIEQICGESFYKDRNINLQEQNRNSSWVVSDDHFIVSKDIIDQYKMLYLDEMAKVIHE